MPVGLKSRQFAEDDLSQASAERVLLSNAVAEWLDCGKLVLLERWVEKQLDPEGIPRRLPVDEWGACLADLARARSGRQRDWPLFLDARVEGFVLQTLRFTRPDGSMVLGKAGADPIVREGLEYWADSLDDPGLKTVLAWWFPGRKPPRASPPLPASSHPEQVLAILRADWSKVGDLAAVDHRCNGAATRFELAGLGRGWLGPTWTAESGGLTAGRARRTLWVSNSSADLAEWSFRVGPWRYLRTALLLRGRRLALLADQVEGKDAPAAMRIAVHSNLVVSGSDEDRSLVLSSGPRKPTAQVIPLGLAGSPLSGGPGSFRGDAGELRLDQPSEGKRRWMPLLVSWDSARNRKALVWRSLTVTENWKVCGAETAVAFRVAWGRDESLVIYRSLARPAPRAFLGHQTRARFLVGLFSKEGQLDPILTVDE